MSLYGISTKILTVIAIVYHQSPSVRYVDSNRIGFIQSAKAPLCKVGDDLSICIWEGEGGELLRDISVGGGGLPRDKVFGSWRRRRGNGRGSD